MQSIAWAPVIMEKMTQFVTSVPVSRPWNLRKCWSVNLSGSYYRLLPTSVAISLLCSAPQSKNAVSTNMKHSRNIHLMSIFLSIHFHTKRLYVHMFDIVDTPFSSGELIICSSLQDFSTTKESTAFLLCGADI